MRGQSHESSPQPPNTYGWLNGCLKWPSLLAFFVINIALTITVIALTIISSRKDGFVTIPSSNTTSSKLSDQGATSVSPLEAFNISWDLGVLWTALPSFAFSLFGAYWAWIAGSIAERQPYVELRKERGAPAKTSVLLDYRVVASIWRWWGAFRNSHHMVGTTTLLSVFLTYAVAPFAARLFTPQLVGASQPLPILYNQALNDNNINSTLDWRPVLDTVAASLLHQGNQIAWTDEEHAFRPFSTKTKLAAGTDVEANTTAYSAYLSCELITDYSISSSTDSDGWAVEVSGDDRGCSFKQSFGVSSTQEIYFKTTLTMDCSAQTYYSRLVFTAGTFSSSASDKLDDVSVISCATGYRQAAGNLRVSPSNSPPTIQSFSETGKPDTSRPTLWRVFEQNILGPVSVNPQTKWSTSDMGSLILYYTQKFQPSKPLESKILIEGISKVFTAIYLNAIAIHGFDTLSSPETATGTAYVPTTRLFVVPWVSYIIITFLAITLCTVALVYLHLRKSPSILTEEPQGLLSMAGILDSSELLHIASHIRQDPGYDGLMRKRGKARPEVADRKWAVVKDLKHDNWVIRSMNGAENGPMEHLLPPAQQPPEHQMAYY